MQKKKSRGQGTRVVVFAIIVSSELYCCMLCCYFTSHLSCLFVRDDFTSLLFLCENATMRVCAPSTAAQLYRDMFHLYNSTNTILKIVPAALYACITPEYASIHSEYIVQCLLLSEMFYNKNSTFFSNISVDKLSWSTQLQGDLG